jgi:RNA polymerase sigma-70 factor (ECF subfamily)
MKNLTDLQIIESVQKGNINDFSLIVDRYKDKAFSLLHKMLKNEMDSEEALQDSFLKAFNALSKFRQDSKFSTWFYKIVYNTGLSKLSINKRKIEMAMTSIDEHYDLGKYDNEIYSKTEEPVSYILSMVEKLPVRNGLVLILYYLDDLSLNEISQIMNISLVNAKVLLHRSRNALRELLLKHNFQKELI